MLFSRGNWSIFGVRPESILKFRRTFADPTIAAAALFGVSQLKASVVTRYQQKPTVGINPFADPRLDESLTDLAILESLSKTLDPAIDNPLPFAPSLLNDYFGTTEEDFKIGSDDLSHYYGFWAVFNDFDDVTDVASKKEQLAYTNVSRPYKFLNKDEKKGVDSFIQATNVLTRKQFPVLIDFVEGRVYAATTTVEEVEWVRAVIENLGGECFGLHWDFDSIDFPSRFLSVVDKGTKPTFEAAMKTRADELTRFSKKEIEKLEDKMMEKIVSNFFAIAELETGQWAALKGPSKIKLSHVGDPVTCAGPSEAFTLLRLVHPLENSEVASATIVFQELTSKIKKDVEYQVRNDLFTLVLDNNVNLQDAGAALLKGFDLPAYKRDVMKEIKQTKAELPVQRYWDEWLRQMRGAIAMYIDNMTESLQIDKKAFGLNKYESEETTEEVVNVQ